MNDDEPNRGSNGRFVRNVDTALRDAQAVELKAEGKTFAEIATALGYADKGHAWRGVQRALDAVTREPAERLIQVESEQLDLLYATALEILAHDQAIVSHGLVVYGDDGSPLVDDGPKLSAIREARQIRESYRKLHGLDAEKKVQLSGGIKYEVVGVSAEDLV